MRWWAAAVCCWLSLPLLAAEADQPGRPLWEVGAGLVVMSLPDYIGSQRQRNYLLPYPYVIYRGERIRLDRDGLRGILLEKRRVELDFSVGGALPVNSDDNPKREGMPNLDAALEIGPSLKWSLYSQPGQRLRFELPLRALLTVNWRSLAHEGWVLQPRLAFDSYDLWGSGLEIDLKLGVNFNDQAYNNYYYGVAQSYATAERPAYRAEAGYGGANASVVVGRHWGDWFAYAFVRYDNLLYAEFEESPLVETRHAVRAGINVVLFLKSAKK